MKIQTADIVIRVSYDADKASPVTIAEAAASRVHTIDNVTHSEAISVVGITESYALPFTPKPYVRPTANTRRKS